MAQSEHDKELELHWRYFLELDRDVYSLFRYIEPTGKNLNTYSIENVRLLFSICSEVEVILKNICLHGSEEDYRNKNIMELLTVIMEKGFEIHKLEIHVPRADLLLQPWKAIVSERNNFQGDGPTREPAWWQAYNNVKHNRSKNYQDTKLRYVLESLCGLLVLHLYWFFGTADHKTYGIRPKPISVYYNLGGPHEGMLVTGKNIPNLPGLKRNK